MTLRDLDMIGCAEIEDLKFSVAGIGTGEATACGDLSGNGDDPHRKTGGAASFLEHQSHRRNVKRRYTLQETSSFLQSKKSFMKNYY